MKLRHFVICSLLVFAQANATTFSVEDILEIFYSNESGDNSWEVINLANACQSRYAAQIEEGGFNPYESAMVIATCMNRLDIFERLLEQGISENLTLPDGRTLLHVAAERSTYHMAERLIQLGLSVNKKDKAGQTPLTKAIDYYSNTLDLLVYHGADIRHASNDQKSKLSKRLGVVPGHEVGAAAGVIMMALGMCTGGLAYIAYVSVGAMVTLFSYISGAKSSDKTMPDKNQEMFQDEVPDWFLKHYNELQENGLPS